VPTDDFTRVVWKKNKRLLAQGFRDLEYLPKARCGWDCSLASLAYGVRTDIEGRPHDLNAWAARHCIAAGARYEALGPNALVLWHGTSRERADKIAEHGLFHKKGLWTTLDPRIAHVFCRGRSARFGTEGAVVCIVLDGREFVEGRDYDCEGADNVLRFHYGLPPDVVEYVLVSDEIRFSGSERARRPSPWRRAEFEKRSGQWVPAQRPPVWYTDSASYGSVEEFAEVCVDRLLEELGEVIALEVFSTLYASVRPGDVLSHRDIFDLISRQCVPSRQRGKWQVFARAEKRSS
jgi:hypothetical protein